ncbi:NUDIX domain-containing protein [Streptomyces chrestomyceticus]|uniref:NUDIX domain-containing protein n=1 Tax=Streptomyces chrestomyceticus TaxID=68185 RepID=UPI0036AD1A2C
MAGGETSPAAARELREETGVTVPAADLSQMGTYDATGRDPRGRYVTVTYTATLPSPVADSHAIHVPPAPFQPSLRHRHTARTPSAGSWIARVRNAPLPGRPGHGSAGHRPQHSSLR